MKEEANANGYGSPPVWLRPPTPTGHEADVSGGTAPCKTDTVAGFLNTKPRNDHWSNMFCHACGKMTNLYEFVLIAPFEVIAANSSAPVRGRSHIRNMVSCHVPRAKSWKMEDRRGSRFRSTQSGSPKSRRGRAMASPLKAIQPFAKLT